MNISISRKALSLLAVGLALAVGGGGYLIGRGRTPREMGTPTETHELYQCSMHPQIVSDKPGNCPICGMRLQKVDRGSATSPKAVEKGKPLYFRHPMRPDVTSATQVKDEMGMDYVPVYAEEQSKGPVIAGHASFSIPLERQQLIGVKTATAAVRVLDVEIRAVGRIAYDPELYNAIEEYKQAAAARGKMKDSPLPDARNGADAIVRSAGTRLRLLGLSQAQIDKLAGDGQDPINLLLPDKTAWVYAEVYESEVGLVRSGQDLSVTAPSLPGRSYHGKVVAVDSVVNAETRTARVRGLIETPSEALRPETFVNVRLAIGLGRRLAVPEDSVLVTGENQLVFVRKARGEFEPREVKLGRQAGGYYEILSGLKAGEEVVTAANFLIDSESRFRAAAAGFTAASKP